MTAPAAAGTGLRVGEPAPGVLLVALDRPERRNALSSELLRELAVTFAQADARAAVLAGHGPAFCAGYDLHEPAADGYDPGAAERLIAAPDHAAFGVLATCPFPVIAAVHGAVLGGGLELAACCDLRIAAADASFAIPAGRLGLTYSAAGLERIARAFGLPAVHAMALAGTTVGACDAERLGAVTEVSGDRDGAIDRALALAGRAAAFAPGATAANKRALAALAEGPLAAQSPQTVRQLAALRHDGFARGGELHRGIEAFLGRATRTTTHPRPASTPQEETR
jgi:enoyl-CoA hydratase/carnithine racemase